MSMLIFVELLTITVYISVNTTFNSILAWSWRSVLLMEETEAPGENHRPDASHRQILLHKVVSSAPRHLPDSK